MLCTGGDRASGNTDGFLVDLNFRGEVRTISLDGDIGSRRLVGSVCELRTILRDIRGSGVLQREGILPEKMPELVARDFRGNAIARFPMAAADVMDLRLAPSGQAVAAAGVPGLSTRRCANGLYLARNGATFWDLLWCPDAPGPAPDSVSWSPDEQQIAFAQDNSVFLLDLKERKPRRVDRGRFVRWAPTGNRIVYVDGDRIFVHWLLGTDPPRQVEVPGLIANSVEWSPDGERFTVARRSKVQPGDDRVRHDFAIVDTGTWQIRALGVHGWGDASYLRWAPLPLSRVDDLVIAHKAACK